MELQKDLNVHTKYILEIYCDINNCALNHLVGKESISELSGIKNKVASILNDRIRTDIFTGDIVPFAITPDFLTKILYNGKF